MLALVGAACTGGGDGDPAAASATSGGGEPVCLESEASCGGECVTLSTNLAHCGACGRSCPSGPDAEARCIEGTCSLECAEGFVSREGGCTNFLGGHQSRPAECAECLAENPVSSECGCPSGSTQLDLWTQAECVGSTTRSNTELALCLTQGVSPESDFGGAYQVDDIDGWCGSVDRCRVGNPLAGGACDCPVGFNPIGLRSVIRLPCDNADAGTRIYFCGNPTAAYRSFAGAFQTDDLGRACRYPNPWTGDCSCPEGSEDRSYRAIVDGTIDGTFMLYGSALHLCTQ
jgi:hypothetical protein